MVEPVNMEELGEALTQPSILALVEDGEVYLKLTECTVSVGYAKNEEPNRSVEPL